MPDRKHQNSKATSGHLLALLCPREYVLLIFYISISGILSNQMDRINDYHRHSFYPQGLQGLALISIFFKRRENF
jgi:hypothetical protein